MKLTIISGSHRHQSQSTKIAHYIQREIERSKLFNSTYVLDLSSNPIPFYKEKWKHDEEMVNVWEPYHEQLETSDAFVIVSPEWNGMVPSGLKNIFLLVNHTELAHKPALIVTVSSGRGGAFPVQELRLSTYKNSFINYIPMHVIIRKCEEVLNSDEPDINNKEDQFYRNRISYSLKVLKEYSKALIQVRQSGVIDVENFKNGMS